MSLGLPLLDCPSPTSSSSSAPSPVTPTYYGQEFPHFDPKHMISPYSSPSPAHDIPFYLPHQQQPPPPPPPQPPQHHHHQHPQHHHQQHHQQHPAFYTPPPQQHSSPSLSPTPSSAQSKTYSFVSLPGNAVKKRPRRRYDEIERPYRCNWGDCDKAYGTLNHLNNHVVLQAHGEKRNPAEFKELRMQLKLKKKGLMASQAKQEQVANPLAPQPQDAAPSCAPTSPSYQMADPSMMYPVATTTSSAYYSPHHQRNLSSSYELAYPSQPSYPSPTHYDYSSSSSSSCRHSFGDYESSQRESMWAPRSSIDSLPANSSLFTPLPGYSESYHPSPSLLPSMRGGQIPAAYRYEGEGRPGWNPHH